MTCVFAVILAGRRGSQLAPRQRRRRKKHPNPSSSLAGRDPAATTVTRTNTVEINNWIAGTSRSITVESELDYDNSQLFPPSAGIQMAGGPMMTKRMAFFPWAARS